LRHLSTGGALHRFLRSYGVPLDADKESIPLIGSQEGLAHLLMAVANPGDGLLMTSVAYPSYFGAAQVCLDDPF